MAWDVALDDLLTHTVTTEPQTAIDVDGKPTYGAAVSHKAKIVLRTRYVRAADGRQIAGRGTVYLKTPAAVPSAKDRLTMPAGFEPLVPPILDVRPHYDEDGASVVHHVELVIG